MVRSAVADFAMTIENVPSENPKTGRITTLSVISLLRRRTFSSVDAIAEALTEIGVKKEAA